MNILAFDTGLNLGYAVVNLKTVEIFAYGVYRIGEKISIEDLCISTKSKCECILNYLKINSCHIDKIVIELPRFYDSMKGRVSAKRQDLFYPYASAITVFNSFDKYDREFMEPSQLTKKATAYRVKKIFPYLQTKNSHIIDAISLALMQDKNLWNLKRGNDEINI